MIEQSADWDRFQEEVKTQIEVRVSTIPMAARALGWTRKTTQVRAIEDGVLFDGSDLKLGRAKYVVPTSWVERRAKEGVSE